MKCVQAAATAACRTASFCLFCGDVLAESVAEGRRVAIPSRRLSGSRDPYVRHRSSTRVLAARVGRSHRHCIECLGALLLTFGLDFALRRFGRLLGISPFVSKVATGMAFIMILAVGSWLYCAFAESSSWRATMGKRLLGLQVVTAEGGKTSFGGPRFAT